MLSTVTSKRPRATLPKLHTSFIGRQREIDEVRTLLKKSRLITITGSAGCGKTRLAVRLAEEMQNTFLEGVVWVELAPLEEADSVPQAVAKALGTHGQPGYALVDLLLDTLVDQHILIVLDNCEHLLGTCSQLALQLMSAPQVHILATSREPLSVVGELRYPLAPLTLPASSSSAQAVISAEAVQLFVERTQAVVPHFALTPQNASTIAHICQQLDGIPLAIELACARLNVLTVEQIAARLSDQFALLTSAAHLTHHHHQTLRAAIAWSYHLLSTVEQTLLMRLSLFAADFSLETVEAACTDAVLPPEQTLVVLSSLFDKSILVANTLNSGSARYRLLEMMRQFAHDQLVASGNLQKSQDRYIVGFLHMTEALAPKLFAHEQQQSLEWLQTEHDNIRMALHLALERQNVEIGLRIANALYPFWEAHDYLQEGFSWYQRLLALPHQTLPLALRVYGLTNWSYLAMFLGDAPTATAASETAVKLCEEAGDLGDELLRIALTGVAGAARTAGDLQKVVIVNERIMALLRLADDQMGLGMSYYAHGMTNVLLGEYAIARQLLADGLRAARESEHLYGVALVLNTMGDLARCEGHFAEAVALYEESVALCQVLGTARDLLKAVRGLAFAHLRLGNYERAHVLLRQAIETQHTQDNRRSIVQALGGFAALAAALAFPSLSARLLGFVEQHLYETPMPLDSQDRADNLDRQHFSSLVRTALADDGFDDEYAIGQRLSWAQAVSLARNIPQSSNMSARPAQILTQREWEIALLIAQGLTNGEIAQRLVLSKRTVEKHTANILSKLAFTHRAQIVRWTIENKGDES